MSHMMVRNGPATEHKATAEWDMDIAENALKDGLTHRAIFFMGKAYANIEWAKLGDFDPLNARYAELKKKLNVK